MNSQSPYDQPLWRPSAGLESMRQRAKLMATIRGFFEAREVLEVETPLLSRHATVDRHIESFSAGESRYLQTSPEFAMKRLLCAGSGPIWQMCKVFRREEAGRHHNPEFSLLEWYRPGFDHYGLMDEVEQLLADCGAGDGEAFERLSYREAFLRQAGFDPFTLALTELAPRLQQFGVSLPENLSEAERLSRDFWLDLWMSFVVAPALGAQRPCFLYDFPASQAALARVRGEVAERFEVIWRGVELANGFHELSDAVEQRRRFEADQAWRAANGRAAAPYDALLIDALAHGLPDCAGVAVGIDRLLMLLLDAPDIASVLSFDWPRA